MIERKVLEKWQMLAIREERLQKSLMSASEAPLGAVRLLQATDVLLSVLRSPLREERPPQARLRAKLRTAAQLQTERAARRRSGEQRKNLMPHCICSCSCF